MPENPEILAQILGARGAKYALRLNYVFFFAPRPLAPPVDAFFVPHRHPFAPLRPPAFFCQWRPRLPADYRTQRFR